MTAPRKLLYVSAVGCPAGLERELAAANWSIHHVRGLKLAARHLREEDFQVALVRLEHIEHSVQELQACWTARACEWVAVMPPAPAQSSDYRELMLNHIFLRLDDPPDHRLLLQALEQAWERSVLERAALQPASTEDGLGLIGRSAAMVALRRTILKAGPTEAAVLIGGESGSGKELVARALHSVSRRAGGPFVVVNCATLTPTLIVSELFGHERGSFTGAVRGHKGMVEEAAGGTLFLDEVAELPLDMQATLLRYLQEKTIQRIGSTRPLTADGRVIAASHVDVAQAVAADRFREDLYFRLNVLSIHVPALRERRDDIPLLAQHFFEQSARQHSTRAAGFSTHALAAMSAYDWPGNVRELSHRVQRAVIMAEHRLLTPTELGLPEDPWRPGEQLHEIRVRAERTAISVSLDRSRHNITLAARDLGVSRMTLYRLMAKHHIKVIEPAPSDRGASENERGRTRS